MAAILKKRALAEYGALVQMIEPPWKRFKISVLKNNSEAGTTYFNLLKNSKSTNEAFKILLSIPDSLKLTSEELQDAINLLCEHFHQQNESAVRAKILSLFCSFGQTQKVDIEILLGYIIKLIDSETSHKVIAQCLLTMLILSKKLNKESLVLARIVEVAKHFLKDTHHQVKRLCLQLIASVDGIENLWLLSSYTHNEDARVRSTALEALVMLHKTGIQIDVSFYYVVCGVLNDDYDTVRVAALSLVSLIGNSHPDYQVIFPQTEEAVRLIDDAFVKICQAVNDSSIIVRHTAVELLGTMTSVSRIILNQTLVKKLMSNLKKRESYHGRTNKLFVTGRKKWTYDDTSGFYHKDEVGILSNGSLGALIQGLEDDSMEIRIAAVNSLCSLALTHQEFAVLSLDHLVEMLGDEIEAVRLKAIECLTFLSPLVVIQEYQLEIVLGAVEDSSVTVREGLHKMMASCKLSSKECMQRTIEGLLDNLKKYPCDKNVTWDSARELGKSHSELILPIIPRLLGIHPFFDSPDPNVENQCYITLLIFIFNAAKKCPAAISLFEECTIKHYTYLRASMPSLVPHLIFTENNEIIEADGVDSMHSFLWRLIDNISATSSGIHSILPQLESLTKIDSRMSGMIQFVSSFISCQVLLNTIKKNKMWDLQKFTEICVVTLRADIVLLLSLSLKLQHLFLGLKKKELTLIKNLQLTSFVIYFIFMVKYSKLLTLDVFYHIIDEIKRIQQFFCDNNIVPCAFAKKIFSALKMIDDATPLDVANQLLSCLSGLNMIVPSILTQNVRMSYALLIIPNSSPDSPLKFTAGLILDVKLEAQLFALQNPQSLRVKVHYPNNDTQYFTPSDSDLQASNTEGDYRLQTKALLHSHCPWSEACYVEISLCIEFSDSDSTDWGCYGLDPFLELCKPLKLYVRPRPVMKSLPRGIL